MALPLASIVVRRHRRFKNAMQTVVLEVLMCFNGRTSRTVHLFHGRFMIKLSFIAIYGHGTEITQHFLSS